MFSRILTELENDRTSREEFRREVRDRFDAGSARMDEIHSEVRKTNGRVTRLENAKKAAMAKLAGALAILSCLFWAWEKGLIRFGGP